MEEIRTTTDPERAGPSCTSVSSRSLPRRFRPCCSYYPIYTYAVDAQVREVQLAPMLHTSDRFGMYREWYVETEEIEVSRRRLS